MKNLSKQWFRRNRISITCNKKKEKKMKGTLRTTKTLITSTSAVIVTIRKEITAS